MSKLAGLEKDFRCLLAIHNFIIDGELVPYYCSEKYHVNTQIIVFTIKGRELSSYTMLLSVLLPSLNKYGRHLQQSSLIPSKPQQLK
jgi:hypothetical protein